MGMIMHDDVPYGEGTSYTQGTGIVINNNVIAVDADNTPTENSEKPVKSKGVSSTVKQIYADNGVLGAKNLLPNTSSSGTYNGITYTKNSDGSVTANGTAIALTWRTINSIKLPVGKYILNGCPAGGDTGPNTYCIALWNTDGGTAGSVINVRDGGDGVVVDITQELTYSVNIGIANGQTVNNLTFYPMLRLASDPDDTYVPYAMTNRELTEKKIDAELTFVTGVSIDTLTENKRYYCSGGMTGLPTENIGYLDVHRAIDGVGIHQTFYPAGRQGEIYVRRFWDNAWGSWYKFTGTVVS